MKEYTEADQFGFLVVQCPTCGAVCGRRCTTGKGNVRGAHKARRWRTEGFIEGSNYAVRVNVMADYTAAKAEEFLIDRYAEIDPNAKASEVR